MRTIFTQRGHRGTPKENPAAYARSSSLSRVDRIETPLLVMHGGRDVRAPARQHVLLVEALKKHGKPFEERVYATRPTASREGASSTCTGSSSPGSTST